MHIQALHLGLSQQIFIRIALPGQCPTPPSCPTQPALCMIMGLPAPPTITTCAEGWHMMLKSELDRIRLVRIADDAGCRDSYGFTLVKHDGGTITKKHAS